ncbi:cbb3-type cytochrome oxidase assembly protein CcoS [Microbulbifer sp. CAU 1566]|uniref:cbb3-type cytochrome oxidase assembly protein CcoS n=1 Tax=Microbulbifer sp. CAU 1566 TaxID=2933269 RepID=UPI002003BD78|nr:cbb3-type cytochrome oxidase assembly protein CcoS [Microbulbifer sp. CAU 1566]
MDSIFLLVPIVVVFVAIAVKLFFWAVNSGQYDDLETEARRILFDDEPKRPHNPTSPHNSTPPLTPSALQAEHAKAPAQDSPEQP